MDELTVEQQAEQRKYVSMIIQQNGNVAARIFTGQDFEGRLGITAISSPIQYVPTCVAFVNPNVIDIDACNDLTNPDGGKPVAIYGNRKLEPPKPKKTTLKLIK